MCRQALLLNGKCWCPAKQANPYIPVQCKQVTRGFIFVFIYIELSQIYKSIFKLNIKGNSHIVQDEREHISCESPLAWRRLVDAALPVVENLQKYRYILENIDGVFRDFS
jgi:hypothetical protein